MFIAGVLVGIAVGGTLGALALGLANAARMAEEMQPVPAEVPTRDR